MLIAPLVYDVGSVSHKYKLFIEVFIEIWLRTT